MLSINEALNKIMEMDFATREMLLEILQKRQAEERRKEIARHGRQAKAAFDSGKTEAISATELIKRLNTL